MDDGNKRSLSMIVIAVAIGALYFFYNELSSESPVEETEQAQTTEGADGSGDASGGDGSGGDRDGDGPGVDPAQRAAMREVGTIRTDSFEAEIDNLGGGVTHFRITGDERFHDDEDNPLDVVTIDEPHEFWRPLKLRLGSIELPDDIVWDLDQVSEREVRLSWEGEGLRIVRSFSAGQGPYQIWHTVRVQNLANYPRTTRVELATYHYVQREEESGGISIMPSRSPAVSHGACIYDDESERKDRKSLVDDDNNRSNPHGYGNGDVDIAAVENVYFTLAMAAHGDRAARCGLSALDLPTSDEAEGTLFEARLLYPWTELAPGEEQTVTTLAYIGPKDPDALNLAGHQLPEMVDLGFFAVIASQLARLLHFLHGFIPNWGLAIIVLTLLIRLALFPITNLSFSSMAKMRQLKPEIDRINERFKDDPEKKGAAVMALYGKHKINPLMGCLPMLAQMPVFWALYTSLSTNIELYHMPFALWWTDLSSPDPYYVLPVCLGLLMHLQQRLSPNTMDAAQAKMMMYMMPIMITVFMLFLPSGLCLYMLTSSALGIAQMQFNNYRLSRQPPLASDEDDDESPDDAPDDDDEDGADSPKQKRRPRRKRRVRRGRA